MIPLEMAILPRTTNDIRPYINGSLMSLENPIFISENTMYIPFDELRGIIDNVSFYNVDDISNDYKKIQINDVIFVEGSYFVNELGITIAYEYGSGAVYIASKNHFDGYLEAPDDIFSPQKENGAYDGKYMYVDGRVLKKTDNAIFVRCAKGSVLFETNTDNISVGDYLRFCFKYNCEGYYNEVLVCNLMEYSVPNDDTKMGFMIYTEDSWDEIKTDLIEPISDDDYLLDRLVINDIFLHYPEVFNSEKKMRGILTDMFPLQFLGVNLFIDAYELGIMQEIDNYNLDDFFVYRFSQKLISYKGIQSHLATETVSLWCETYGSSILHKEFISKTKYSRNIQLEIEKRQGEWKSPNKYNKCNIGNLVYPEPIEWNKKEAAFPYEGTYYYPYLNSKDGMIWVTMRKNYTGSVGEDFGYEFLISGFVKSKRNIKSINTVFVDGIYGKKVNCYTKIADNTMELDIYIIPTDEYIYALFFGEKLGLSPDMCFFEQDFLSSIMWNK